MPRRKPRKTARRKYVAYVVPHTHWDRAWYLPFEEFRMKLVRTFDKLLEIHRTNPRFKAFSFDGQTVVLEDYLQIRPRNKEAIRKHVRDGRLAIGPWYVLPDEFLVSGEAMIRNLLIGHQIAGTFGRVMKVGYIPDPFGHISQIPQILRGFGIDSMIFSRGSGHNVREAGLVFKGTAPDEKSWVYAVLQPGMYVNLGCWGVPKGEPMDTPKVDYELALRQVENLLDLMEKWKNPTRILLFNNGWDHALAQPKVPDMIDYVNRRQNRANLVQGTFEDFIRALRKDVGPLASVSGELHEGAEAPLLSGIFSTRMYIKQANAAAQTLLEKVSEPLAAFAWALGAPYPQDFLLHAWKELLKCHPHDDIGGCSVDSVHAEAMCRFRRVGQVGKTLSRESLEHIARNVGGATDKALILYNPLGFPNSGEISVSVLLRKSDVPPNSQLLDQNGTKVPALVTWAPLPENLPKDKRTEFGELSIAFLAKNLPPCGYRVYMVAQGAEEKPERQLSPSRRCIENEFFVVTANLDGTVNVRDKETGAIHKGLNFFEDVEDAGDEYDYSPLPAPHSRRITSQGRSARISVEQPTPYRQCMGVSLNLRVPCGLTPDRTARSRQTIVLPIRSVVTLYEGIRRVDFETTVENRVCDHRLRAGFPTGIRSNCAYAESKFDVVRRPLRFPKYTQKYRQSPVPTQHVGTFVDVHDGKRGFAVLNQGLPEYEAREEAGGVTIYQTLFRSVGWLSRPDLLTRKEGNAGPEIPTPGAQMLGAWTFRYSIVPHRSSWEEADVWQAAHSFASPMFAHFCDAGGGTLPRETSFLSVEPDTIALSAVKRSESGGGIIVRLWNPTARSVRARLRFFRALRSAYLVRLDERRLRPLKVLGENSVVVSLSGKGIGSVEIRPS